jgi:hypothetical protein
MAHTGHHTQLFEVRNTPGITLIMIPIKVGGPNPTGIVKPATVVAPGVITPGGAQTGSVEPTKVMQKNDHTNLYRIKK